jgi:hypothetical protein
MVRIEILGFAGCPNLEPTVRRVHQIASAMDLPADITVRMLDDADDPALCRFLGSPTVQVNGIDIEPAARSRMDFAFGCRVYGETGTPPASMIETAIRDASTP